MAAHITVESREEAAMLAVYACSILSKANIEQELPAISGEDGNLSSRSLPINSWGHVLLHIFRVLQLDTEELILGKSYFKRVSNV